MTYLPGFWQPIFGPHVYSNAALKIEQAEDELRGRGTRMARERAQRLIWC